MKILLCHNYYQQAGGEYRVFEDEAQLLASTAHGRCIFTFNLRDFVVLAQSYPRHGGIILAAQASWTLSELVMALDRLLSETEAEDWTGLVRWLNDWR